MLHHIESPGDLAAWEQELRKRSMGSEHVCLHEADLHLIYNRRSSSKWPCTPFNQYRERMAKAFEGALLHTNKFQNHGETCRIKGKNGFLGPPELEAGGEDVLYQPRVPRNDRGGGLSRPLQTAARCAPGKGKLWVRKRAFPSSKGTAYPDCKALAPFKKV